MRHSMNTPLALFATSALVLAMPAPAAPLAGFDAEFRISYLGMRADAWLQLQQVDGDSTYRYEVRSEARGIARMLRSSAATEETRFVLNDNRIVPLHYALDDGGKDAANDTVIKFDWEAGVATSVYEGTTDNIELSPGVHDRLSADIAVILDLREGRQPGTYRIAERNRLRDYVYSDQGSERIRVPAGEFEARKFLRQRPGSSRSTLIWYARDAAWLPVRIEQLKDGKSTVTMVATRVSPAS